MTPQQVIYWLWDAWVASWVLAALWSARAAARPPLLSELWPDALALAGAAILIGLAAPVADAHARANLVFRGAMLAPLWATSPLAAWALVGLTGFGFAFCWWARIHLGRLWSGFAERKADHRVVDTGPYRWVRHPIYTGLLTALLAMAALKGTIAALIGLALATTGLWLKASLEERFLRAELGPEIYDAYKRRTPMLLPLRGAKAELN
jgi:protein-S-isoprenylcysteine O-methyltransferase Ste14